MKNISGKPAKDKKPNEKPLTDDFYPNISNTASANDFTGIMFKPPQNDEELEAYEELYNMKYQDE